MSDTEAVRVSLTRTTAISSVPSQMRSQRRPWLHKLKRPATTTTLALAMQTMQTTRRCQVYLVERSALKI